MLAQFALKHATGITDTAQTKMSDIGLTGHQGHRNLVAQFTLAQIGIKNKGIFIGRAKTAGKRHGTDNDVPRVFQQFLITLMGLFRMIDGTYGHRVARRA